MNVVAFRSLPAEKSAGRICPRDYSYAPAVFARTPDLSAETLYVAGGLYGNLAALASIETLAAAEHAPATIVFNGDFHWFDAEPAWFDAVERGVTPYRALRGNLETEIGRGENIGAGCGCAYPETVDDGIVQRSNEILAQLANVAPANARRRLRALPMHLVAQVGSLRVGIVHGDAVSLAGWRFAHDALDAAGNQSWLGEVRRASGIDVFACTHTCLAALRDLMLSAGRLTVINNGAAGMPNFAGTNFGVVTRIASSPSPYRPLYGLCRDGVHIDALAINYDQHAFLKHFLARWPKDSPACASYYKRIVEGPDYTVVQASLR